MIKKKEADWFMIYFYGIFFIGCSGLILSLVYMYIIDAFFKNWGEIFNIGFSIYLSHFTIWIMYKKEEHKKSE